MNLLLSLLILIAVIGLTICYAVIIYFLGAVLRFLHKKLIRKETKVLFMPQNVKKHLLHIIICISLILSGVYIKQRVRWINDDCANRQAKEFWVAGQTVAGLRFTGMKVLHLHPDNILLAPFLSLQKIAYNKGVELISDGEKYVWLDFWFLYPYSRREILPYGVDIDEPSPRMISLLDDCWEALEGMATEPIQDKQMREDFYLRHFPRLSSYYVAFDGFYMGQARASLKRLLKTPKYVKKLITLLGWLEVLEQEWHRVGIREEIVKKTPIVNVVRGMTRVTILKKLVRKQLIHGEFACSSVYLQKLRDQFIILMDPKNKDNYLWQFSWKAKSQAMYLYDDLFYSYHGSLSRYLMKEVCHLDLPHEQFFLISKWDYDRRIHVNSIKRTYKNELSLIKEK